MARGRRRRNALDNNLTNAVTSTPKSPQYNQTPHSQLNQQLDDEIEVLDDIPTNSKPIIQTFRGHHDKITIENWLKRYELLCSYLKWSDKKQLIMLGNYFEDDALNWYIENCDSLNWVELKLKLIERFGHETADPIVEFINLKYDPKLGVKDYFDKKVRLGTLAKLTESQIISVMIQGLNPKMISNFVAVKPKSFNEFYIIAKNSEDNFKRSFNFNQNKYKINDKNANKDNINKKLKKKPPNPCRICENLGLKDRYHWAQDCLNKNKLKTNNPNYNSNNNTKSNQKQANSVETEVNSVDFPILSNINLN